MGHNFLSVGTAKLTHFAGYRVLRAAGATWGRASLR